MPKLTVFGVSLLVLLALYILRHPQLWPGFAIFLLVVTALPKRNELDKIVILIIEIVISGLIILTYYQFYHWGILVVLIGFLSNFLVQIFHGLKMPVDPDLFFRIHKQDTMCLCHRNTHTLDIRKMRFLGDIFLIGDCIVSIGDILLLMGLAVANLNI